MDLSTNVYPSEYDGECGFDCDKCRNPCEDA